MRDIIINSLQKYLSSKKLSIEIEKCLKTMNNYNFNYRNTFTRHYDIEVIEKFLRILQRPLTQKEKNKLKTLSNIVFFEVMNAKDQFNIPRPFVIIPQLPYIKVIGPESPSFPSGHAAGYRISQLFFSIIDPIHKENYHALMLQGANSRIIGGVHTPADIEGGFIVADIVFSLKN